MNFIKQYNIDKYNIPKDGYKYVTQAITNNALRRRTQHKNLLVLKFKTQR